MEFKGVDNFLIQSPISISLKHSKENKSTEINSILLSPKLQFIKACENGNAHGALELYSNYPSINIHDDEDYAFRYSCINGHLELAKWLYNMCNCIVNVRVYEDFAFVHSCANGHIEVAQWLLEIEPSININAQGHHAFKYACKNGHFDVAQWLFSLNPNIDISIGNEFAFRSACARGHLTIVQWLRSIKPTLNIHAVEDHAFNSAYCEGHSNIITYLLELDPKLSQSKSIKYNNNWLIKQGRVIIINIMNELFKNNISIF